MLKSFRDSATEAVWRREGTAGLGRVAKVALRRLGMLNFAGRLDDLRVPPGNRLEKLKGNRKGQYSVRVNERYRICFRWQDGDAYDVEIVDYH